jgi:phospholipid/cholesterol/gamma-HCH transport system substrate-binding protein
MDRLRRDTLLGLVFFGSLAFLLWATINLTDLAVDKVRWRVSFDQAGSCEVGTNVMVLGRKMGKVGVIDVLYDEPRPVALTLMLREEVPIRSDYQITIKDQGLLGGKQIYIDPGRTGTPVAKGTTLQGIVEPGSLDAIGNIAKGEGKLGNELLNAIGQIKLLFTNMNNPDTSIGRLTNSRELHDSLVSSADRLGEILKAVIDQKGMVGDLVMNEESRDNVHRLIANLRSLSTKLDSGTDSVLGVLFNDRAAAMDLQAILRNVDVMVEDVRNGHGIVGTLLRNDALASRFTNIVGNLDVLLANLTNPDAGAFGALTSDPATARDIKTTLAQLRAVSDKLASKDGMLGMLINDPDLGARWRRIITQVSRALEDAREAAPIGNFIQVLLGAF